MTTTTKARATLAEPPTTAEEVADFLGTQGTPGQSVTNRTVLMLKATRLALGHHAAEQIWQLGRIEHFKRGWATLGASA